MSLLRNIQNAAVDSSVPLPMLLRQCKILAARLANQEFKSWVEHELSGYPDNDSLPPYRVLTVNSKGHFSGPFQSGLRNADIPLMCLPEKLRKNLSHSYMREPVSALEMLIEKSDSSTAQEPWNPDIVAHVGQDIYEGMNCMQAWKVIPMTAVVAAVDTVRTRILNFVLEIEAEAPDAGEAPPNSQPLSQERVTQIFNTYISGAVQNVATGSTNFSQQATQNTPEVFETILAAIREAEADSGAKEALASAVEEMRNVSGSQSFVSKYHQFMSVLADHAQVFGPVIAPYLPALGALLP